MTSFRHSVELVPKLYSLSLAWISYHWIFSLSLLSSLFFLSVGSIFPPKKKNMVMACKSFFFYIYSIFNGGDDGGGLASILLVPFSSENIIIERWVVFSFFFFFRGLFPLFFLFLLYFLYIPVRKSQHFFLPIYFFREYLYDAYADRDNIPLALNK